jgi:uncharacterized protein
MKLHPDAQSSLNTVTAYGETFIDINAQRFESSILVQPEGSIEALPQRAFPELDEPFFAKLAESQPELVILGTGKKQRFPHPKLTRSLIDQRIGLESMTTAAAVRTYNILMAEGRKVLGAFLIEDEDKVETSGT